MSYDRKRNEPPYRPPSYHGKAPGVKPKGQHEKEIVESASEAIVKENSENE